MAGRVDDGSPASRLESRRRQVLAEFERRLDCQHRTVAQRRDTRHAVLACATDALDNMIAAVRDDGAVSWQPDGSCDDSRVEGLRSHPADVVYALTDFLGIAATTAAECVTDSPHRLVSGMRALTGTVSCHVARTTSSARHHRADELREARREERRRFARTLHDRLGADINVAHRHLELYEVLQAREPARAHHRVVSARQSLATVMTQIRQLAAGLRVDETFDGLERGLREFLAAIGTDAVDTRLVLTGDEEHLPLPTRAEVYLVIREAVRNALVHSRGSSVSIAIDIRPGRLHTVVRDDGVGLGRDVSAARGTGMASMRERVMLLDGSIHIDSSTGCGTTVEILVPHEH
ncbi:sensor histidine kinase [Micromonospora sp. WMMD736]|uniref:sensor histidine kinase n=1 Tax=Micromonospora sp. WMMD736 TaxID=3404112 RepID=UPI003B9377F4